MNGVHCQTRDASIDISGTLEIQSGCGASWLPNSAHTQVQHAVEHP